MVEDRWWRKRKGYCCFSFFFIMFLGCESKTEIDNTRGAERRDEERRGKKETDIEEE